MFTLRHEGRGWVRVSWKHDARPAPEVSRAMVEASRIPGVVKYENALAISPTAFGVVEVVKLFNATKLDPRRPKDTIHYQLPEVRRPLYPYQYEGAKTIVAQGSLLLSDSMGLGKTPQAIVAAATLAHDRPVVIVAPLFTRDVWRRELEALGFLDDPSTFCALATRDLSDETWNANASWYFVHYDIVQAWHSRFNTLRFDRRPAVVIVDEAHYIKHGNTQRAKGTYALTAVATHRILLTGTPMESTPRELWSLLRCTTGPQTWGSSLDFRRRYCGALSDGHHYVDGDATHVDELRERMAPWYLRRTVEDVALELPALTRTIYTVDIDEAALRAHDDARSGYDVAALVRAIAQGTVNRDVLALITRLRKITSKAKEKATNELLHSLYDQGEHVVVFTWEKVRANAMFAHAVVTGDVPQDERDRVILWFQGTKAPTVLSATYGALREGVTLHRARTVVLHDLDWLLTGMLQAEGRVRRIGQKRACQSLWVVAKGTIDELISRALLAKAEVLRETLGTIDATTLDDTELTARAAGVELGQEHVDRIINQWVELRT